MSCQQGEIYINKQKKIYSDNKNKYIKLYENFKGGDYNRKMGVISGLDGINTDVDVRKREEQRNQEIIMNNEKDLEELQKLQNQYELLINEYDIDFNNLENYINESINRVNNNKYANRNITMNGAIAYVTKSGISKWYQNPTIYDSTIGKNGCPSNTPLNTGIDNKYEYLNTIGSIIPTEPNLLTGSKIIQGQSCGYEGENIYVTELSSNPTSTFIGCYVDSSDIAMTKKYGRLTNERCRQVTLQDGYKYYSLQNYNDSDKMAECFGSNDLDKAKKYGTQRIEEKPLWSTGTGGTDANMFVVGNDGSLNLYNSNSNNSYFKTEKDNCTPNSGVLNMSNLVATYGANCGEGVYLGNVTEKVIEKYYADGASTSDFSITANNATLTDTYKNCSKNFDVSYDCGGKNYIDNGNFYYNTLSIKYTNDSYVYINDSSSVYGWYIGTAMLNNSKAWGFPTPYPNGNICVSIQSTKYIYTNNDMNLDVGTYILSFYACARNCCAIRGGENPNPINIQLYTNDKQWVKNIELFTPTSTSSWIKYTFNFNVETKQNYRIYFVGTSTDDRSTALQGFSLVSTNDSTPLSKSGSVTEGGTYNFSCEDKKNICDYVLMLNDDGNLQLFRSIENNPTSLLLWETNKKDESGNIYDNWNVSKSKFGRNYMKMGESLSTNEWISSNNSKHRLILQVDGNLVLYTNYLNDVVCPIKEDGYNYGGEMTNAIFQTNESVYPSNMGKLAYIDDDTILHEYDTSIKKNSNEYITFDNYNSASNDLQNGVLTTDLNSCYELCNENDKCYGLVYGKESKYCYLKNSNTYPYANRQNNNLYTLAIRKPALYNSSNYKNNINFVDSITYQNYPKGENMNANTKKNFNSNFPFVPKTLLDDYENKITELKSIGEKICSKMEYIYNQNTHLLEQMNINKQQFENNIQSYKMKNKQMDRLLNLLIQNKEGFQNLNMNDIDKILNSSEIKVLMHNYKYIGWSSVALILLCLVVSFSRK